MPEFLSKALSLFRRKEFEDKVEHKKTNYPTYEEYVPPTIEQKRKLLDNLVRLTSRSRIQTHIYADFMGLRKAYKDTASSNRRSIIGSGLLEREFTLYQPVEDLLSEIQIGLQKHFDIKGLALIVLGSNANGGALIRELAELMTDSFDLDYAIVSDEPEKVSNEWSQILTFIEQNVVHSRKKYGLPDTFHVCEHFGGASNSKHLVKVEEALQRCYEIVNSGCEDHNLSRQYSSFFSLFYPTVPPNYGEENRRFIWLALNSMWSEDPNLWKLLKHKLIAGIKSEKGIRAKHLEDKKNGQEYSHRAVHIQEESPRYMVEAFAKFIDSTATSD